MCFMNSIVLYLFNTRDIDTFTYVNISTYLVVPSSSRIEEQPPVLGRDT